MLIVHFTGKTVSARELHTISIYRVDNLSISSAFDHTGSLMQLLLLPAQKLAASKHICVAAPASMIHKKRFEAPLDQYLHIYEICIHALLILWSMFSIDQQKQALHTT